MKGRILAVYRRVIHKLWRPFARCRGVYWNSDICRSGELIYSDKNFRISRGSHAPPTRTEEIINRYTVERWCTWSGLIAIVLFFTGFVLSQFVPPLSPALTPEQVVAHYQQHANSIRGGMVIMMISGMFMAPFIGVISAQIKRMQGISPALSYSQISAGTANAMFFFIPALLFVVTAYRPERNPDITFFMNDMAWIIAVLPWPPAFMQNLSIAAAILTDKSPEPIFPRWLAYLNIWVSIAFIPGGLLPFFKVGPFAWSGLLVFWLAGSVFVIWFIAMVVMLFKAINRQEAAGT